MSEDVLERVRVFVMSQEPWRAIEALRLIDALAAEVRALRARVVELEADHEWISERCAGCGHRFAYPSNYCAQCNEKVGPTEPDVYPELCECPRCIVARNVAMDAALSARSGEDGA